MVCPCVAVSQYSNVAFCLLAPIVAARMRNACISLFGNHAHEGSCADLHLQLHATPVECGSVHLAECLFQVMYCGEVKALWFIFKHYVGLKRVHLAWSFAPETLTC